MGHAYSKSSNRLDRLVALLFILGSALGYFGYLGYTATRPVYRAGSLPADARGGGAGSCRMTFMSPAYFRLPGFNKDETRLGNGPWGLYLYREAGWDNDPVQVDDQGRERLVLGGTPVLFVPGNAGSFKQVRSLASVATRSFWELPGVRRDAGRAGTGGSSLDFFTLDFNDDFSAFHGQTLFDQAEYTSDAIRYILGLYASQAEQTRPAPTSLIVVAHSMGGIVARATFLDPHYPPDSVSTLITFATPHLLPPVTIDSGVDHFYSSVNSYWRDAYNLSQIATSPASVPGSLRDVVTISIGGGISDEMIASETTSLDSLVPGDDSNGFAVSTTAIPGVQTPIDHLAILWCNQLMQVVAESILAIVDSRNPSKVVSREARIEEFSSRLLGGLERKSREVRPDDGMLLSTIEQGKPSRRLQSGERLTIRPESGREGRRSFLMPVATDPETQSFSLLTSAAIGEHGSVQVYGCANSPNPASDAALSCAPLSLKHLTVLPTSPQSAVSPTLPASAGDDKLNLIHLDGSAVVGLKLIVVVVNPTPKEWVLAEFAHETDRVEVVDRKALRFKGTFALAARKPSQVNEIWLDNLDTALLSFKLEASRSECQEKESLFAPILRQYSSTSHESRFFPNIRTASLYTHSAGPYLPPRPAGVRLQFFVDPNCAQDGKDDVSVEISIDLLRTAGNLFLRYRMSLVTIPFALIMLVFAIQIHNFDADHTFPPFHAAVAIFVRRYLPALLVLLSGLGLAQTFIVDNHQQFNADPLSSATAWTRDALLGNSDIFWVPLFPILIVTSFAVVVVEYFVLSLVVSVSAWMARRLAEKSNLADSVFSSDPKAAHLSPIQRFTALALLLVVTVFFAPYQFAFLVLFLIHLLTTIRILVSTYKPPYVPLEQHDSSDESPNLTRSSSTSVSLLNQYHFSFSVLFLLLSLLPINALILIVWVRNLAVGSFAPFSSDRQPFSIVGFLALVESIHSGQTHKPSKPYSASSVVTLLLAGTSAAYSLVYGIRTAYQIYTLANVFAGWLALVTSGRDWLAVFARRKTVREEETPQQGTEGEVISRRKLATTAKSQD